MLYNLIGPRSFILILSSLNSRLVRGISRLYSMDVEMASASWRGVPLSEIIGSQSPWGAPEFPLVSPGRNHTVLYHIPSNGHTGDGPLKPQIGQDKWDSDHVRMPCSKASLYPVKDSDGETHLEKRWNMIQEALRKPILNSEELANVILSYNTKFKTTWKFRALHALFNDHLDEEVSQYFFTVTLPQIAQLALELPKLVQAPIPLLKQHKNHSISLTQLQIASLLANAFFCTFPRRNTSKRNSEYSSYPHINFSPLYECAPKDDVLEKLTTLCHYFRRVCTKAPRGVATFTRRSVPPRACPSWQHRTTPLSATPLHVDPEGKIEDQSGLIQLDFANKYLGGGVLGYGSVQEEIRFAICPELMVSMLFTEVLRPNEALLMIGCERYSDYSGYGRSFRWAGDHRDLTPSDSAGRRRVAVLAVDAAPYSETRLEYRPDMVTRDLNKAWVGFSMYCDDQSTLNYPGVATGNWGCGAFGGSPQLKSLIQLMAAAEARRPMAYYTFEDIELRDQIINIYNLLARYNVTVGQLYQYIVKFSTTDVSKSNLHAYLHQVIMDEDNKRKNSHQPDRMDICTTSPRLEQINDNSIQEELCNRSPDLFSQEEDHSQRSESQTNKQTERLKNNTPGESNTTDSKNKMAASDDKMAPQTRRLFDELQKFDEENGKLNLNPNGSNTSRYFDGPKSLEDILISSDNENENDVVMASNSNENTPKSKGVSDNKMEDSENKMAASTSRLFDEMQKFDNEHGRLNLNVPCTPPLINHKNGKSHESDASIDSDRSETSSATKKKIAKKITDYFSKKNT